MGAGRQAREDLRDLRCPLLYPPGALTKPAARLAAAPASASQEAVGQGAASFLQGVREGSRVRARAFRPQGAPPAPAPPRPHTGGFPLRRGRPRPFYITIDSAGNAPLAAAAPTGHAPIRSRPALPAPRRLGGAQLDSLASTPAVTCWLCRAAQTLSGTPCSPWRRGVPAGIPPRPSPAQAAKESRVPHLARTRPQGSPMPRTS